MMVQPVVSFVFSTTTEYELCENIDEIDAEDEDLKIEDKKVKIYFCNSLLIPAPLFSMLSDFIFQKKITRHILEVPFLPPEKC